MITVSNFSYAGTQKYVSHAVAISSTDELKTLCGMDVYKLLNRIGQEWEVRETNEPHSVGCAKCLRLLTKRTPDEGCQCAGTVNRIIQKDGVEVCAYCFRPRR